MGRQKCRRRNPARESLDIQGSEKVPAWGGGIGGCLCCCSGDKAPVWGGLSPDYLAVCPSVCLSRDVRRHPIKL